jgi:hypothetical protein
VSFRLGVEGEVESLEIDGLTLRHERYSSARR